MNLSSHLAELQKKHETLSQQIEAEQRSPGSDDLDIRRLKAEKLRLKDEIQRMTTPH
jgi:hypothetical protein